MEFGQQPPSGQPQSEQPQQTQTTWEWLKNKWSSLTGSNTNKPQQPSGGKKNKSMSKKSKHRKSKKGGRK
jgi:hypothetical protein